MSRRSGIIRDETQEGKILRLLQARGLAWTPAPELAKISLQYCRAVAGLRRRGFPIENRLTLHDSIRHGSYRLAPAEPRSLFGDLSPERHPD
jgi:hypothetical protein